ncbi:MAG: helix-turn-helix domain-containing protein [Muribaculum sp.]|nr:helix-turn-helix domain-containing protein [Muribaculum sp.]
MANDIVTKADMRIIAARSRTKDAFDAVGVIRDSHHPVLAGICFLDDKEAARRLRVTRRTIQNYRDKGILSYYMICGKCLYAEHEIQQLLDENFHPAYYG